ncbi:MAG: PIG-L family deacetylase [Chloroflexi bacterium]|nr:MAG: PIG-L family deacetylase [Chloroflexota bacterium]
MNNIQRLLAIIAHPDDETYRAGGTLALLAQNGAQVWVLCATRGERGIAKLSPEDAGSIRQTELVCACRTLGIEPPRFLDYEDGTLSQGDGEQAIGQIARAIRELRPQALLTWPPDGVSGHPDHSAVSRWTDEAWRLAADPAYQTEGLQPHTAVSLYHIVIPHSLAAALEMTHLNTVPDEAVTLTVDVSAVWDTKMAAIHCHRSQMVNSPILDAPEARQRLFLGTEYFRRSL